MKSFIRSITFFLMTESLDVCNYEKVKTVNRRRTETCLEVWSQRGDKTYRRDV